MPQVFIEMHKNAPKCPKTPKDIPSFHRVAQRSPNWHLKDARSYISESPLGHNEIENRSIWKSPWGTYYDRPNFQKANLKMPKSSKGWKLIGQKILPIIWPKNGSADGPSLVPCSFRATHTLFSAIFSHLDNNWTIWVFEKVSLLSIFEILIKEITKYFSFSKVFN